MQKETRTPLPTPSASHSSARATTSASTIKEALPSDQTRDTKPSQCSRPFFSKVSFWYPIYVVTGVCWFNWLLFWGKPDSSADFLSFLSFICFTIAESITIFLGFFYYVNFLYPHKESRVYHSLASLSPAFDQRAAVNVLICHCFEGLEDTQKTLTAALQLDRTFTDPTVWILDDSFLEPKVRIDDKADRREGEDSFVLLHEKEADVDKLLTLNAPELPAVTRGGRDLIKMLIGVARREAQRRNLEERMRNEDWSQDALCDVAVDVRLTHRLSRPDCAFASLRFTFFWRPASNTLAPWRPVDITLVARVKPQEGHHHYKAGNINNAIYNEKMGGQYALFLDNDMVPSSQMLNLLLPWHYKRTSSSSSTNWEEDDQVAFVQSPQWTINLKTNQSETNLMTLSSQVAKDNFDMCQCNGTNMLYRMEALRAIEGMPYDSFTEDTLSGLLVQRMGYRSVYVPLELAVGSAAPNSAALVLQRLRWAKGTFQICLLFLGLQKKKPVKFTSEAEREEFRTPKHFVKQQFSLERKWWMAICLTDVATHPVVTAGGVFYILASLFSLWSSSPKQVGSSGSSEWVIWMLLAVNIVCRVMSLKTALQNVPVWNLIPEMKEHLQESFPAFLGIIDAWREAFLGTGTLWQSTGIVKYHWSTAVISLIVILFIMGQVNTLMMMAISGFHVQMLVRLVLSVMLIYPLWEIFIAVCLDLYRTGFVAMKKISSSNKRKDKADL